MSQIRTDEDTKNKLECMMVYPQERNLLVQIREKYPNAELTIITNQKRPHRIKRVVIFDFLGSIL